MALIKQLSLDVSNAIAAGEVVDEPVGAVKELVENSIDAGASHITIEIANGGEQITVIDDGCGIAEEDVELAFAKYATSKLQSVADLFAIQSLGFRGEALPSIAAVSRIKLTTRSRSEDVGVCVSVENGVVSDKQYVSANNGTKIEVRDLYYNTPARKEFLKNPSGEKANITKFVTKLILTNPNIAFTYRADGKTVYESKGNGLDEAIFSIYGEECLSNCLQVNYQFGNLRINGYIGTPEYSKANKNYQTLSVNGRYIIDPAISGAIARAYMPRLMTHQFPFFVLNIEIPGGDIDVNIHPKKSIVRFKKINFICSQFYHAAKNVLQDYTDSHSEQIFSAPTRVNDYEAPQQRYSKEEITRKIGELQEEGTIDLMNPAQRADVIEIEQLTEAVDKKRELKAFAERLEREVSVAKARERLGLQEIPLTVKQRPTHIEEPTPPLIAESSLGAELFARTRVLGAAFQTYLILNIDDKMILVDQHAAHERILFDKFMQSASKDMQPLMIPHVFSVSDDEALFIGENLQNILSAGFEVQPFGHNTFRITAVSSLLINTRMTDFVEFLLASTDEFKLDDSKLIVEAIAKKACKAAVKAGQKLNEYEIQYILEQVYENKILQCPHGRPITVILTKTQLEKMFKRIV